MKKSDTIAVGPDSLAKGPLRWRVGRTRFIRCNRYRIVALAAAILGLSWLPMLAPPGDLPMRRAGEATGSPIRSFTFSRDGRTIAVSYEDGRVALRDGPDGSVVRRTLKVDRHADAIAFSMDGRYLAMAVDGPDVIVSDLAHDREHALGIEDRQARQVRFAPDGPILAMANSRTGEILLWDIQAGHERMTLRGSPPGITAIAFAPDGQSLASANPKAGTVHIWDLNTGVMRGLVSKQRLSFMSVAYAPDSRRIATGGCDETSVRVWDARSGILVERFETHSGPARTVDFSPDGRWLATGAGDGTVCLWDVATRSEVRHLEAGMDLIRSVAFSPDGRTLAAAGNDSDLRLWDLEGVGAGTERR